MYINEDLMLQTLNLNNYTLRNYLLIHSKNTGLLLGSLAKASLKLLILTEEITQGESGRGPEDADS